MIQLPLAPYKLARIENPSTSKEAAKQVKVFASKHHAAILIAIREHPGSHVHAIASHCGIDAHKVGKRLNELEKAGYIRTEGEVMGPTGRNVRLWWPV